MKAWLTVDRGEAMPPSCELIPGQPVTLGRHRNNTIILRDEHASRWHAVVVNEGGHWYVNNIGVPINGTRVNGERIGQQVELADGQQIGIGDTLLRFRIEKPGETSAPASASASSEAQTTPLQGDELTVLCNFLMQSVEQADARTLILQALETIQQQTRATLVGFLSLDADAPLPKIIWPEQAQVDFQLSRQLTQQVQVEGRTVWIAAGAIGESLSDSLGAFRDALCIPLRAAGTALGALHVYKSQSVFQERHLRFCEVLAGYLASSLNVLRARRSLEAENSRLRDRVSSSEELIGNSNQLRALRQIIGRVASRNSTVLVRGESGVGKELVALALHRQSPRRDGPLVAVNCAAIAATLPEAELFGHRKGTFTGADRDRPGLFQQADEGTLFLDEIGELPLDCQAKLLRVMESHTFRPVGATQEIRVDVRIVAATNRELEEEVRKGKFRQDLLYRLQVIQVEVPALRQHPDDIPLLAAYFLEKLGRECRRTVRLSPEALSRLQGYSWPGNIRQLRAVLESAVVVSDKSMLDADDLPIPADQHEAIVPSLNLEDLETWAIRQALRQTKGNVSKAARILGVVRDTLTSKMKRKDINRESL
ncbi:MAG: sigma 54-interacting transcriptional regulator [Planctomycetia bacterium]|nr:sigma 54-interacting transcriptional regulator [Planctomycetia bacterium]